MNSLLYYYNNVQKMAAYRQAKRMQCGVKLGENQLSGSSSTVKFISNPIPIGTDDFSVEFYGNVYGQNGSYASVFNAVNPSIGGSRTFSIYGQFYPDNGVWAIAFSPDTSGYITGDEVRINYSPKNDSQFLISVTRQGTTVKAYINGELKATKEQSEVKDLGDLQLAIANSSDVGFVRVWNYALSADEIATLYNNGDPMGYVVPKLSRQIGPDVYLSANVFEFNIGSPITQTVIPEQQYPFDCIYRVSYVVDEWDFQPSTYNAVGFIGRNGATVISGISTWYSIAAAKIGEEQSFFVKMPSTESPYLIIYGSQDDVSVTARRLKVTVNSITPVGLLAEYLPQNLMYGRDDKTIATSWLDSAKQLPLSDEYMEPLFQSIGGYDMAANGAPEILYRTYNYDYVGAKLGYQQPIISASTTKFVSAPISIGTSDFSIEFYGNTYGSYTNKNPSISNQSQPYTYGEGCLLVYQTESGVGGIEWIIFEKPATGADLADSINLRYKPIDPIEKFHFVITRQGTTVKVYINGELKTTKEQSEVKDMGDLQLAIANSSDVGFVRVWNKCLSDSEVSQLENSGDPAGYVLPAEMKTGDQRCIAEYLAMNLVPQKYKPTVAARWLDSATVLPDPDGTLRRIWKSVGGYDMEANGNPIILQ